MTKYTLEATFELESDLTNEEIVKIKKHKGNLITSDKVKLISIHENRICEIEETEDENEKEKSACSCQWELSAGSQGRWDSIREPEEFPETFWGADAIDELKEFLMDADTQKELDAWMSFSMSKETKDRPLEDLWEEFKATYKA